MTHESCNGPRRFCFCADLLSIRDSLWDLAPLTVWPPVLFHSPLMCVQLRLNFNPKASLSACLVSSVSSICHNHLLWAFIGRISIHRGNWALKGVSWHPSQKDCPTFLFFSLLFSLFRWYRAGQRVSWLSRNQLRNEIPITSFHAETTNLYNAWTIFFIYLYFRKGSTSHGWEAQSLSLCTVHPKWPSSTFSPLALLYWQRWKQRW